MRVSRRELLTAGLVAGAAPTLFACSSVDPTQPVAIVFDRDTCAHCAMMISDRKFAAQSFNPKTGKHEKFDDPGCMAVKACETGFDKDPAARLWVMDGETGTVWLDARTASYVEGAHSPMGYGFSARPPGKGPAGFERLMTAALERAHCTPKAT